MGRIETEMACKPNFGAAGRRRRRVIFAVFAVISLGAAVLIVTTRAAWPLALLMFFPVSAATGAGLQLRRNTCVERARAGTSELEDFTTVPASPEDAAASRRVAATIRRDAIIAGALASVAAAVVAHLR
jgi:hypothetical protein